MECTELSKYRDGPLDTALTLDDLERLVVASIAAPDELTFGVIHGVTNNHWKRFDISDTRTAGLRATGRRLRPHGGIHQAGMTQRAGHGAPLTVTHSRDPSRDEP